jgi:hypothetical protein
MMSVNAVLMKFFKLPPAVRMMLALLGFGSLASILFRFVPGLRSTRGLIWMMIIFGVGLVVFLVVWGVRRVFRRKKSAELGSALESQGPSRGDIAEQERIYREKFHSKLSDLKANGLSVYHLPWFVLMGEPGCGKTASLINSGLDFPLGKDEVPGFGGTRNYNWWFSNEAVILDTAGRIAFQEEGTTDKLEWEYFLKLLRRYRPRCPINGVIIAIPADKLLRDSSEERAQKATILRERLRQVHQLLGVRFPTFVLVTKMDLAGGFGEFFEEIRVDLQQRNQMFGWSRPGEFQEPYDPADFVGAFDTLYYRVRDWGMRYLQRKATDEELGLIVTFPESFRQLRDPLNDYVSTIFQKSPLLEPPFFRGFYFTSAVQEGAPIFDVFARSSVGHAIAERPARAVDSKAFFIHDLYANKVFPEKGLVFRSAKHVTVNRRMRRIVWIGSAAMILIMLTFFGFGHVGVSDLVTNPRVDCEAAHAKIVAGDATFKQLPDNVRLAQSLHGHYQAYSGSLTWLYARMLFIGASITQPREHVQQIHARFVLDCILRPVIRQVEQQLRSGVVPEPMSKERQAYVDALRVYTQWYGEIVGQHGLDELSEETSRRVDDFDKLLTFVGLGEQDRNNTRVQYELAVQSLARESRAFALQIQRDTVKLDEQAATQTIRDAMGHITRSWMPYTDLRADRTDPRLKYWVGFIDAFANLQRRYEQLLALRADFEQAGAVDQPGESIRQRFAAAAERFDLITKDLQELGNITYPADDGTFLKAYHEVIKFLSATPPPVDDEHEGRILRLEQLRNTLMALWVAEFDGVEEALRTGAPPESAKPGPTSVYRAIGQEGKDKLEEALDGNLAEIRATLSLPPDTDLLDHYARQGMVEINEARPGVKFKGKPSVTIGTTALGTEDLLPRYLLDMRELILGDADTEAKLGNLTQWVELLTAISDSRPPEGNLGPWITAVQDEVDGRRLTTAQRDEIIAKRSQIKDRPFWKPAELYHLGESVLTASQRTRTAYLLGEMAKRAQAATAEEHLPGLAQLMPGFKDSLPPRDLPFNRHQFNAESVAPREAVEEPPPEEEEEEDTDTQRRRRRRTLEPTAAAPARDEQLRRQQEQQMLLARYHTRKLLAGTLDAYWGVCEALQAIQRQQPTAAETLDALNGAAQKYIDQYFIDWHDLYTDYRKLLDEDTLELLSQCRGTETDKLDWPRFQRKLAKDGGSLLNGTATRFEALVREAVLYGDAFPRDPRGEQSLALIEKRLTGLRRTNRSLPDKLYDVWKRADETRRTDAEGVLSGRLTQVWTDYLRQVEALGPEAASGAPAPDLAGLRRGLDSCMRWQSMRPEDFHFVRPWLDVAEYGQQLLVHHLAAHLAEIFEPYSPPSNRKYPIMFTREARDTTPALERLRQLNTLQPDELLKLLREVTDFRRRYGELYETVNPDSDAHRTLKLCQAWVDFLYEHPEDLEQGKRPDPLDIKLTVRRAEKGLSAFSLYKQFTISLPFLKEESLEPQFPIRFFPGSLPAADGKGQVARPGEWLEFRWSLFATGKNYGETIARASDKNTTAKPELPGAVDTWRLPGDPWTLLLLIGADEENDLRDNNKWRIPVVIKTSAYPDPYAYDIIVQLERPFPGPIQPLAAPGEPPRMGSASRYLEPPSPGSGRDTRSERSSG